MFNAFFISYNHDFDICYTVEIYGKGWTSIACNGDDVGFNTTFYKDNPMWNKEYFIDNLIVYIKGKTEHIPNINDSPRVFNEF